MIALPDSLALGSQACCALLTRKPECHRGGREHAPRREAGGARGHCAWRPTSRGQWARPLRSQQPRAEVARAWPCIRRPHPTLHRFCVLAGGGGSTQCLVWTQGDSSSLSPLRGPFVSRWLMWPRCGRTPAFGQGRKFLLRAFVHWPSVWLGPWEAAYPNSLPKESYREERVHQPNKAASPWVGATREGRQAVGFVSPDSCHCS